MDALVTTDWLAGALGARDLSVLDATYVDAGTGRDPAAEYRAGHIPGAVFMDLGELRDTGSPLPMTLPAAARFAGRMQALGIGDGSRIVLYDDSPWRTAARAWWMLRHFGARDVAILDGGLAKWRAEGRPLAKGADVPCPCPFAAAGGGSGVRTFDELKAIVASRSEQILDARSGARFTGAEPDPRPGVASGHMPGARNLPYPGLFNADGTYKRGDALAVAFIAAGIDLDCPIVTTCGSGITAATLIFALHLLGREAALYDGSWSEWGADRDTPKACGV